jgi:hypothetical protein
MIDSASTRTQSACPLVMTGSNFRNKMLHPTDFAPSSPVGAEISLPGAMGDALSACGSIADFLNEDEGSLLSSYLLGSAAYSDYTVCCAIDPCAHTYMFGVEVSLVFPILATLMYMVCLMSLFVS